MSERDEQPTEPFVPNFFYEPSPSEADTSPVVTTYQEQEGESFPDFEAEEFAKVFTAPFLQDGQDGNLDFQFFQDMEELDELYEFASQGDNFDAEFEEESYEEALGMIDEIIEDERVVERMAPVEDVHTEYQKLVSLYLWMFENGEELFRIILESEVEVRYRLLAKNKQLSEIDMILVIRLYALTIVARRLPLPFPTKFKPKY